MKTHWEQILVKRVGILSVYRKSKGESSGITSLKLQALSNEIVHAMLKFEQMIKTHKKMWRYPMSFYFCGQENP